MTARHRTEGRERRDPDTPRNPRARDERFQPAFEPPTDLAPGPRWVMARLVGRFGRGFGRTSSDVRLELGGGGFDVPSVNAVLRHLWLCPTKEMVGHEITLGRNLIHR
jgi:hypothetical protein